MGKEHEGEQLFTIHLEFFKPYPVVGAVFYSRNTSESEFGSALRIPV
jgi:hypothetical protein